MVLSAIVVRRGLGSSVRGAAAACLGSVLASTMRRVEFAMTTVPFRPDLTAFKVHFLIRTYHVLLTVMTGLLLPSAIEIL